MPLLVLDPKSRTISRYLGPKLTHRPVQLNHPDGMCADPLYLEALEQYRIDPEIFYGPASPAAS